MFKKKGKQNQRREKIGLYVITWRTRFTCNRTEPHVKHFNLNPLTVFRFGRFGIVWITKSLTLPETRLQITEN